MATYYYLKKINETDDAAELAALAQKIRAQQSFSFRLLHKAVSTNNIKAYNLVAPAAFSRYLSLVEYYRGSLTTPKTIRHCMNTAIKARHDWIAIDLLNRIWQADGGNVRERMVADALDVAVEEENTAMVEHIVERILQTGLLYEIHILTCLGIACSFNKARSVEAFVKFLRTYYEKEAQNPPQKESRKRSSWLERVKYLSSTLLGFGRHAPFNCIVLPLYIDRAQHLDTPSDKEKHQKLMAEIFGPKNFSEVQFRFLCTLDLPEAFVQDLSEYLQTTLGVSNWASLAGEWHFDRVA
ncbi:hypothetical protein BJX65DRAFT_301485 [Aspergillus insuetus]